MLFSAGPTMWWVRTALVWVFLLAPASVPAQLPGAQVWSFDLMDQPFELALIGDVSNDGKSDLVAGTLSDEVKCVESARGREWWYFPTNGTVWCVSGIGDVNDDAQEDVIAGTAANEIHCMSGGALYGVAPQIWKYTATSDVWSVCRLPDITGDSRSEAIAGTGDDRVLCLNGATGALVWQRAVGADVWRVRPIADLNGDKKADVIAGCADNKVYAISGATGSVIWSYATNGDVWDVCSFPDITGDGDGVPEVLAVSADNKVTLIKGSSKTTGSRIWALTSTSDFWAASPAGDVTGDGVCDAVAGGLDYNLYLLDGLKGTVLAKTPMGSAVIVTSGIADASRDNVADVLAGEDSGRAGCLSGRDGALLWRFQFPATALARSYSRPPRFSGNGVRGVASIPDLDRDGIREAVFVSAGGGMTCLKGMVVKNNVGAHWLRHGAPDNRCLDINTGPKQGKSSEF
ncbi:MAG: PQQ-binding-like beta-propeller repeat protein [Candidatus Sumerlaeia bacterium]